MKKILIFLLAMVVFSCHKKKDDPAPASSTTTGKTITVYVTRNDFYPKSTDFYSVADVYVYHGTITASGDTMLSGNHNITQIDNIGKHPAIFSNIADSIYYMVGCSVNTSDTSSIGGGNWFLPVIKGKIANKHIDSLYIHAVYE